MPEKPDSLKYEGDYQSVNITPELEGQAWSFDTWGCCNFQNEDGTIEQGNFYTDPRITQRLFTQPILENLAEVDKSQPLNVVDFAGGSGIMLSQINQQLQESGFSQVNSVLTDIDDEKLREAQTNRPELKAVKTDIFHLPFADNSIDVGVSRNLLQYFPGPSETTGQPNQFDILKEMYRVMKPGSTLIIVWPGSYTNTAEQEDDETSAHDIFWANLTWQRTHDDNEYPPREDTRRKETTGEVLVEFAQKAGFQTMNGEEEDWVEFRYTAEAFMGRFGKKTVSMEQQHTIETMFSPLFIHGMGLDSIDWNGKEAVRLPISRLILKKEATEA